MKRTKWTDEDNKQAMEEGWCVSEVLTEANPKRRHQLQKLDEGIRFTDDDQVWRYVWALGCASQASLEGRALQFLLENSPEEYKEITTYAWQQKLAA